MQRLQGKLLILLHYCQTSNLHDKNCKQRKNKSPFGLNVKATLMEKTAQEKNKFTQLIKEGKKVLRKDIEYASRHKPRKLMKLIQQLLSYNSTTWHKGNKSLTVFIWCSMRKSSLVELFVIRQPLIKPFLVFHQFAVQRLTCFTFWNWYWTEIIFNSGWHWATLKIIWDQSLTN